MGITKDDSFAIRWQKLDNPYFIVGVNSSVTINGKLYTKEIFVVLSLAGYTVLKTITTCLL